MNSSDKQKKETRKIEESINDADKRTADDDADKTGTDKSADQTRPVHPEKKKDLNKFDKPKRETDPDRTEIGIQNKN